MEKEILGNYTISRPRSFVVDVIRDESGLFCTLIDEIQCPSEYTQYFKNYERFQICLLAKTILKEMVSTINIVT